MNVKRCQTVVRQSLGRKPHKSGSIRFDCFIDLCGWGHHRKSVGICRALFSPCHRPSLTKKKGINPKEEPFDGQICIFASPQRSSPVSNRRTSGKESHQELHWNSLLLCSHSIFRAPSTRPQCRNLFCYWLHRTKLFLFLPWLGCLLCNLGRLQTFLAFLLKFLEIHMLISTDFIATESDTKMTLMNSVSLPMRSHTLLDKMLCFIQFIFLGFFLFFAESIFA